MRFQLVIVFKNSRRVTMDVPDLTVAHSVRRSFSPSFILDWSVTPLLAN